MAEKTGGILLCAALSGLLLCSCGAGNSYADREMITAMEIQAQEEGYCVTAEYMTQSSSEEPPERKTVSGEGATYMEAVYHMGRISGISPYLDSCRTVVLRGEMSPETLLSLLEQLDSDPGVRPGTLLCRAEEGGGVFEREDTSVCVGEELEKKLSAGKLSELTLKQAITAVKTQGLDRLVPVISKDGTEITGYQTLSGNAAWEADIAALLPFVQKDAVRSLQYEGKNHSIHIDDTHMMIRGGYQDEKACFQLTIRLNGRLSERDGEIAGETAELQHMLAEAAEREYRAVLEEIVKKGETDLFGFGRILALSQPHCWEKVREDWSSEIKNMECKITVEAILRDAEGKGSFGQHY